MHLRRMRHGKKKLKQTKKGPEHKKVVDNLESLEEKIKTIKGIESHQVRRDLLLLRQLPHKPTPDLY